jgi:periplasmic protein TonB
VYRIGGQVNSTSPYFPTRTSPSYAEPARKRKIQGIVIRSFIVDVSGMPENTTVLLPLGFGLEDKAIDSVRNWRFEPGRMNGQPVRVQVDLEVNFFLL